MVFKNLKLCKIDDLCTCALNHARFSFSYVLCTSNNI